MGVVPRGGDGVGLGGHEAVTALAPGEGCHTVLHGLPAGAPTEASAAG